MWHMFQWKIYSTLAVVGFALQHNIICPTVSYMCLSTVFASSILKLPHKNTTNFAKIAAKRTQQKNFQQLCGGDGDSKDEKISVAVWNGDGVGDAFFCRAASCINQAL